MSEQDGFEAMSAALKAERERCFQMGYQLWREGEKDKSPMNDTAHIHRLSDNTADQYGLATHDEQGNRNNWFVFGEDSDEEYDD